MAAAVLARRGTMPRGVSSYGGLVIDYEWRGHFENAEVNPVHAEAFGHRLLDVDWWAQVNRHSLGWVCARQDGRLVGFVNVAWDGGVHAFVLDPVVDIAVQRQGIGRRLVSPPSPPSAATPSTSAG